MNTRTVEECQRLSIRALPRHLLKGNKIIEVGLQSISLTMTPCYFGGEKLWFSCPKCGNRVGMLYKPPHDLNYECRRCKNLIYELTKYRKCRIEKITRLLHKIKTTL